MRTHPSLLLLLAAVSSTLTACGSAGYGGGGGVPAACPAGTQQVIVGTGPTGMSFSPASLTVHLGETVCWSWYSSPHTVVSGQACTADGTFCSPGNASCATAPTSGVGMLYTHQFNALGTFPYFCSQHCAMGMVGDVTVIP
jgi:plastocyanin